MTTHLSHHCMKQIFYNYRSTIFKPNSPPALSLCRVTQITRRGVDYSWSMTCMDIYDHWCDLWSMILIYKHRLVDPLGHKHAGHLRLAGVLHSPQVDHPGGRWLIGLQDQIWAAHMCACARIFPRSACLFKWFTTFIACLRLYSDVYIPVKS